MLDKKLILHDIYMKKLLDSFHVERKKNKPVSKDYLMGKYKRKRKIRLKISKKSKQKIKGRLL